MARRPKADDRPVGAVAFGLTRLLGRYAIGSCRRPPKPRVGASEGRA